MNSKLSQEKMLYESLVKVTSDKDFVISFQDYFSFLLEQGADLCEHLEQPLQERLQEQTQIEELYKEITDNIQETITDIETLSKKLKIQDDPIIKDNLQSIKNFLIGKGFVIDGEKLDSLFLDMLDITRRLYELGFKKELLLFVKSSSDGEPVVEDIFAFKKRTEFLLTKNNFLKKDKRTLAGVFIRLNDLYLDIQSAENFVPKEVKIENFLERFHNEMKEKEYTDLMEKKISQGSHFKKDDYQNDIDRLHQSVVINNPEVAEKTDSNDKIFWIDGDDIYHYKLGPLIYAKKHGQDPKYITIFKKIIRYMPKGRGEMRVTEFEKLLPKNEKIKEKGKEVYKSNLGSPGKSFHKFLKKNKFHNIHPKLKKPIIKVTEFHIDFRNNL